jgi:hypothetical protein
MIRILSYHSLKHATAATSTNTTKTCRPAMNKINTNTTKTCRPAHEQKRTQITLLFTSPQIPDRFLLPIMVAQKVGLCTHKIKQKYEQKSMQMQWENCQFTCRPAHIQKRTQITLLFTSPQIPDRFLLPIMVMPKKHHPHILAKAMFKITRKNHRF